MLVSIGLLAVGLVVLIIGGELLVKGAVGMALKFNVSTMVIGLTVVSFGTSAPELLVSLQAAFEGHPGIAVGNVIGSNIANLALVLGVTAMILPISVRRDTLKVDWSFMMLSTILLFAFAYDLKIVFWEGLVMFALLVLYNVYSVKRSRKLNVDIDDEDIPSKPTYVFLGLAALGCVGLVFGAGWLLDGAVGIAKEYGLSDSVIGSTIIAFGTSVPELATSVIAAFRKETDISLGNLIGSNIFNILCILGITPMVMTIDVDAVLLSSDMIWVLVVSFLVLPLSIKNYSINRWKGFALFMVYVGYYLFAFC